jgi:hypothetical protein
MASSQARVLFIGNSFTARNDVPEMIASMAARRGRAMRHQLVSAGGASLQRHWNKGDALEAIRTGGHDLVVLQEQSTLPIKSPQRMRDAVMLFHQAIHAARAETVLYMTWARQHSPQSQEAITRAYVSIGREIGAHVAPAGIAWEVFLKDERRPRHIVLHDRDGSHPTRAGSFLAACVLYGTLFADSPVGIDITLPGLTAADLSLLQRAAQSALDGINSRTQ